LKPVGLWRKCAAGDRLYRFGKAVLATQIQFAKMRHLTKNKPNRTAIGVGACATSNASKGGLA